MPPAAATSSARFACACPFTSPKSTSVLRSLRQEPRKIDARLRQLGPAVQKVGQLGQIAGPQHADPRDDAGLRQVLARQHQRLEPSVRAANATAAPAYGANRALEPQLAEHGDAAESLTRDCSVAARMPTAIGRSKADPSLRMSAGARLTVMRFRGNV